MAASLTIFTSSADPNAAALQEINLLELLTELAQSNASIAKAAIAAIATGIAPRVIK